jgi:hypothetical protein
LKPPEQQKDPLKDHTFVITESNGEHFKKSIGKIPEPGRLGLYKINFSLPNESALAPRISADGRAAASDTQGTNQPFLNLSRLSGKQDSKYGK